MGTDVDQAHTNVRSLTVDRETVRAFLREMYLGVPGLIQIWTTPKKGSGAFFETTEDGIEMAVDHIEITGNLEGERNIYARVTTVTRQPSKKFSRGTVADSASFIGLWTDIDYGLIGHEKGEKLPATMEEAQAVYDASGLPPASIRVNSGGGLYHYVLVDAPIDITDTELRLRIGRLARRWQYRIKDTSEKLGYDYGAGVSDLARVLRIPGTVNAKVWEHRRHTGFESSGLRYTLEELEEACPEPPKPARPEAPVHAEVATDATDRMNQLLAELAATTRERNNALNEKAFMAFQYAGAGQLDPEAVAVEFTVVGMQIGLTDTEVRATVASAREAGLQRPFAWKNYRTRREQVEEQEEDLWVGGAQEPPGHVHEEPQATPEAPQPQTATQEPPPPAPPAPPATGDSAPGPAPAALPRVDITNERDGLAALTDVINDGALEEVYVREGRLVHVGVVSGARNGRRKKTSAAPERQAPDMGPSQLRALVARNCYTYGYNAKNELVVKLPTEALCKSVLSQTEWPGLPDLVGITTMPFIREDGTVCQNRGYDDETGMWLNVDPGFPKVSETPSDEEIAEAKELLLDKVLRDFPFVSPADRANYMGLLLTPAMKHLTGDINMFGVITAAAAGSGKSLLAEIISRTYGGNGDAVTLPRQDEELRKLITTKLMSDPHAVVTFDNIGKNHRVDSPVLAQLMTSPVWSDRALGGNDNVSRVNDKLWLGTGNNVQLGGEMASRSIMVRIDPKMERPDKRDTEKFVLGNLQTWMTNDANRIKVMHALLVLIRAWAAAGMPKAKIDARTFAPWASTIGGLLDHHGITGFLTNTDEVDEADEESYEWAQFLAAWHTRHPGEWMTTAQLAASYQSTRFEVMNGMVDPWGGVFPVRDDGRTYTNKGLGMKLKYIIDRPFHGWVLRKQMNKSTKQQMWRAERMQEEGAPPPPPEPGQMEIAFPAQRPEPAPPGQRLDEVRGTVTTLLRGLNRTIIPPRPRTEEDRQ